MKSTWKWLAQRLPLLGLAVCLASPERSWAAFGLTTSTDFYTVDTGAGLVFKVRRTDNGVSTQSAGDIASLVWNGVEYQDQSRGSQVNSGFDYLYSGISAVTVSASVINTSYIKVTVQAGNLTHYYMARSGYPHIYMATYFTSEPDTLGLCRYILRLQQGKLPNGPTPSDIRNNTGAIESGDIFGMSDGTTRSKHYSNMRLTDWSYIGASGTNVFLGGGTEVAFGALFNSAGFFYDQDRIVDMSTAPALRFAHTASTLKLSIRASGAGWQGGDDESWGIDNLTITSLSRAGAVPEPATWAMMILGFGGVGATVRRRRLRLA